MSDVRNITGQWLDTFRWSYFVTLTTRYELTLKSARRLSEAFYRKVNESAILKGNTQTAFVYFVEGFEDKKGYHIHALLHAPISKKEIHSIWQCVTSAKMQGSQYCRALDFIPEYGASFYVAKYIVKKSLDWDFQYRGALAHQNPNDLFDYKVTSPFQGWRKYATKGKRVVEGTEGKKTDVLLPDSQSKQCHPVQLQPKALELLQLRQKSTLERKKRIKLQAKGL